MISIVHRKVSPFHSPVVSICRPLPAECGLPYSGIIAAPQRRGGLPGMCRSPCAARLQGSFCGIHYPKMTKNVALRAKNIQIYCK